MSDSSAFKPKVIVAPEGTVVVKKQNVRSTQSPAPINTRTIAGTMIIEQSILSTPTQQPVTSIPASSVGTGTAAVPPTSTELPSTEKPSVSTESEDLGSFGFKVRLFAVRNFPSEYVVFHVSPTNFSEDRSVDYQTVTPVHMPGSVQIYRKTNARSFGLTARLVSRNRTQATENMTFLQRLRGWTMPYFGIRSQYDGVTSTPDFTTPNSPSLQSNGLLGAPPDVLYLYAYSNNTGAHTDRETVSDGRVNIKKVPVVMTRLGISYPSDVDYIPVHGTNEPFPTIMEISIELLETHSPSGYEQFSLSMFKTGQLVQF